MSRFDEDLFLSSILSKKCYRGVEIDEVCIVPDDCEFAYVKTAPDQCSVLLTNAGFTKIETTVNFSKSVNKICAKKAEITTSLASAEDTETLKKLAKNLFIHDRWHRDPNINDGVARKLKEQWIENYFFGRRGDYCLVKKYNNFIAGFLLLIKKPNQFTIDLIGVDAQFQGLGVGRQLINEIAQHIQEPSFELNVTSQTSNTRALSLYESLGFEQKSKSDTWHYHKKKIRG